MPLVDTQGLSKRMSKASGVTAQTPEERQAALTVQSARLVLGEIDSFRVILTDRGLSGEMRRRVKRDMVEASERLCNLMALAVYQIANSVHGELQSRLQLALEDLRRRLLDMGINLMIEKLQKIDTTARAVLDDGGYPLGLASKLHHAYSGLVGNIATLGGLNRLSDKDKALVEATAEHIKALTRIEESLGVLVDDLDPRPRRMARKRGAIGYPLAE